MPQSESDKGCEPATIVPVGVLVELDTEDFLIDWDSEVLLPTLNRLNYHLCLHHCWFSPA